ncbi:MAG: serine/threonine protein kinase [Sandaracinus sp.]|nr:serine/threonine protein kinase [Sandaracinus sp.]
MTPATRPPKPPRHHHVGTLVGGKYRIKRLLGTGGMGAVYKAENTAVGRTVAVKVLHPHLADDGVTLARFQREARVAASVDHPHVVSVLDMGVGDDGAPFLVMEYVRGKSLAELVRVRGPLEARRACHVMGQILAGLEAVHERGVVHRDLKPENVLLTVESGREDFVKILDFGIAAFVESAARAPGAELTPIGRAMTTPYYASPEQLSGATMGRDARVDIYAAGVLLYELLAGNRPFVESNLADLCRAIVADPPPPLRAFRKDLPAGLEDVVLQAMAKEASQRFPSARAMLEALVPFGASFTDDLPEPTDTFTVDLRALREREAAASKDTPTKDTGGAGVLGVDVVGALVEVLEKRTTREALAAGAKAEGLAWPPRRDGWGEGRWLAFVESVDRALGRGDRRLLAEAGRALATRGSRFASPELVVGAAAERWTSFFRDGKARIAEIGRGYGVLEIDHPAPMLARSVVFVGYLDEALALAGGRDVEARLTKAGALGDERDRVEISWST